MKTADIERLVARRLMGKALDKEEQAALEAWLQASGKHRAWYAAVCKKHFSAARYGRYREVDAEAAYARFVRETQAGPRRSRWHAVCRQAAMWLVPLLLAGGGIYYGWQRQQPGVPEPPAIVPGTTEAVLQLAGGATIDLDETTLAKADMPVKVEPVSGNRKGIVWQPVRSRQPDAPRGAAAGTRPNVLQTSRNGEFYITLEDGTKVHLNYHTTLRFPEQFAANDRTVYLQGEAFFEVAPERDRPFRVVTEGMVVRQYGTAFNVNTYSPGRTEVVLVEGSIGVLAGQKEYALRPNQCLAFSPGQGEVKIDSVDVSAYVAWHEGRFVFENESLDSIMQTLSHWYNVEVVFDKPGLRNLHFTGNLDRYGQLPSILKSIGRTVGLRMEIKQRTVYIRQ